VRASGWAFGVVSLGLLPGCADLPEPTAGLLVDTSVVDFGSRALGISAVATVGLVNASASTALAIESADLSAGDQGFSLDGALPSFAAGGTGALTVRYDPPQPGFQVDTLVLRTDTGAVATILLRAECAEATAQAWPALFDFGPVEAGQSAVATVTVAAGEAVDLPMASAAVSGTAFHLLTALPSTIPAGAAMAFAVEFSPPTTDAEEATLSFVFGGGAGETSVALRGNDCAPGAGALYDVDGDGFGRCATDCDDADARVHPGAEETCDGRDDDCDGAVDEGTSCVDDDGDGVTEDEGDCNDADASVAPGLDERAANGIDDDCDGRVDHEATDEDGDGYLATAGDCDPTDATVHPGAIELPDGRDEDCDGVIDEGTLAYDDDGDGASEEQGDCDDADPTVGPYAAEVATGVDDDCDGAVDEGSTTSDDDGDGFSEDAGDCDDADGGAWPGAPEVADAVDDDCDGAVDEGVVDRDRDGVTSEAGDCDDADPWAHPGLAELCDGQDNDCDGLPEAACRAPADDGEATGCATASAAPWLAWLAVTLLPRRRRPDR
jgi:hypothetical protein